MKILVFGGIDTHIAGAMRIVVAITGASGAIYAQRMLDQLEPQQHEVHVVMSGYAKQVVAHELGGDLRLADGVVRHSVQSMNAPFASGSNAFDAVVIIPCSMGTLGRIAHGVSGNLILRAADVALKERKRLVLVPRETPLNLVHVKNMELLLQAGASILPANPSFYSLPDSVQSIADTVVARVLDHIEIPHQLGRRWREESAED